MVDIKQQIGQILYERDALIIPDFGGFVSSYKPATIDHVQGLIHPPSKKLSFNKNLMINDGVLINCLQESLGISLSEARKSIEDFVDRTVIKLDNREIIVFPGIGRLYKDYENNLQFLQDNTNYNTSVYGLPTLQYYPILRSRISAETATDLPLAQPLAARSYSYRRSAMAIMPFALIAIICLGALLFYNRQTNTKQPIAEAIPVVDENRINKKPGEQLSILESINHSTGEIETESIETEALIEEIPEKTDTEAATLSPATKECVIIVGAFSKKAGVEKRVAQIVDLGYSVYQDKKGKLTRVGIQFAYQDASEIREKLEAMRDNFDNRAWILKEK